MNKLNKTQLAEAERLKAIYLDRKKADPSITQDLIADKAGWASQSVVSQYLNGRIPLNLQAILKFASILNFEPGEVTSRLGVDRPRSQHPFADGIGPASGDNQIPAFRERSGRYALVDGIGAPEAPRPDHPSNEPTPVALVPVETWSDETPLDESEVAIPFFKEVELAAGKGSEVMLETGGRKLRFGKRTLQRKGISAETAAAAVVMGNSMEPVLPDGSTVAIDTACTTISDGKMYAINHEGQLRVKMLYRLPGNGLRLRSYNTEEHPDERYDGTYVAEHIRIIGKVFWYSVLI